MLVIALMVYMYIMVVVAHLQRNTGFVSIFFIVQDMTCMSEVLQ